MHVHEHEKGEKYEHIMETPTPGRLPGILCKLAIYA